MDINWQNLKLISLTFPFDEWNKQVGQYDGLSLIFGSILTQNNEIHEKIM